MFVPGCSPPGVTSSRHGSHNGGMRTHASKQIPEHGQPGIDLFVPDSSDTVFLTGV